MFKKRQRKLKFFLLFLCALIARLEKSTKIQFI